MDFTRVFTRFLWYNMAINPEGTEEEIYIGAAIDFYYFIRAMRMLP